MRQITKGYLSVVFIVAAVLGSGWRAANATVSVFTPPLEMNTTQRPACYVVNLNSSAVGVTINLRDSSGTVQAMQFCSSLAIGGMCEAVAAFTGVFYCEVVANSTTIADNLRVTVAREGSTASNAYGDVAALRGTRTGTSSTTLASPTLNTGTNAYGLIPSYACAVVNTSSSAVTSINVTIYDSTGSNGAGFLSIPAFETRTVEFARPNSGSAFDPAFCEVTAPSGTTGAKLRASFYIKDYAGDAWAPVEVQ